MLRIFRLWHLVRRDLPLLWYALRHPQRPRWLLPAVLVMTWYALDPLNFAIPVLGLLDDFVLLPLVLHWLLRLLPPAIQVDYATGRKTRRLTSARA